MKSQPTNHSVRIIRITIISCINKYFHMFWDSTLDGAENCSLNTSTSKAYMRAMPLTYVDSFKNIVIHRF